jgi:HlyD family secretion protein
VVAFFTPSVLTSADERPIQTERARRADFSSVIVAPGRVEAINSTDVRCNLERLNTGGTPTILSLVDDGTTVKQGDLLCEIDSADYKELVRQQTITVQQARASHRQASLDVDVCKIELEAYKKGEMIEADRQFRGQIALAKSDLNRLSDRLDWTERMVIKGYASVLQVTTDRQALLSATLSVARSETAFRNYRRFTAPKTLRALESQLNGAKAQLDFQTIRLNREEERLALYQRMVDSCTVRAPHAGFVIYANENGRPPSVYEGATVRQRQRLFILPDLSDMEVQALLHETVVNRIKVGMSARIRLEALPGLRLEGTVSSISPLPLLARRNEQNSDVTYFLGKVKLKETPDGVRPGMTAELDILKARREGVLAVPQSAVVRKGNIQSCAVLHRGPEEDRVEERTVEVGESSHDLIEITDGLTEGEEVILNAARLDPNSPKPAYRRSQ